jgi:hypothetical protein
LKFLIISLFCVAKVYASNILFIGDSHSVGPFGWELDKHLRTLEGSTVATYGSCGSIAKWWETNQATTCGYFYKDTNANVKQGTKAPTPSFSYLLEQQKPEYVIVELGANYANYPNDEFAINDMKKLVQKIINAKAKCFWITKPDSRKGRENIPRILKLTKTAVQEHCQVFDSTTVTRYPEVGGDGVHYWFKAGMPIAQEWALKAFESFQTFMKEQELNSKE